MMKRFEASKRAKKQRSLKWHRNTKRITARKGKSKCTKNYRICFTSLYLPSPSTLHQVTHDLSLLKVMLNLSQLSFVYFLCQLRAGNTPFPTSSPLSSSALPLSLPLSLFQSASLSSSFSHILSIAPPPLFLTFFYTLSPLLTPFLFFLLSFPLFLFYSSALSQLLPSSPPPLPPPLLFSKIFLLPPSSSSSLSPFLPSSSPPLPPSLSLSSCPILQLLCLPLRHPYPHPLTMSLSSTITSHNEFE